MSGAAHRPAGRLGVLALASLLGTACGGSVSWPVAIAGAAATCAGVDPLAGVAQVSLRLQGPPGAEPHPLGSYAPGSMPATLQLPAGFIGTPVVLEARGLDASGKVVAFGKSVAFTPFSPSPTMVAPTAAVVLRAVGVWAEAASATGCLALSSARAGHTATVLDDGRVLIAGGHRLEGAGRVPLSEVELYDPVAQTLSAGPTMAAGNGSLLLPRTAHTATRLPNGQVLIAGGEIYTNNVFSQVLPLASALIFDPPSTQWGFIPARASPPSIARTRHLAVADASGRVLLAGGLSRSGANELGLEPSVEFDPALNSLKVVDGASVLRSELAGAAVQSGALIALAGGGTDAGVSDAVDLFRFAGTTFKREPGALTLASARRAAAAFARGDDLVLVGGYADLTVANPVPTTEVVLTRAAVTGQGPAVEARGEACAAATANGALVVGGRVATAGGAGATVGTLDQFSFDQAGAFSAANGPALSKGRVMHACAVLHDGALVVVGGLFDDGGNQQVLDDVWLYMPAPAD